MRKEQELYHFGILGMKWGIRRFQNEDGTYTEEGKRRKSKGRDYDPDYWKAHDNKKVEYMSDKELQKRINRMNNEKQYKALTKSTGRKISEGTINIGKKFFSTAVVGVLIGMATKYSKEHIPEIISAGKNAVEGLLAWNQYF